jgi:signal transduction histidine kinase
LKSKVNIFLELYRQKTDLKRANRELKQAKMETEEANRELVEKNQLINLQKDQLLKTLSKLEHSYEDLKKSQKQLVELERKNSIMAMAVTASHELNQPLTVIKGYIGMLEKSMEPSLLSEKQEKYLKKIEHSFEKINALLKKFNEFTSIRIEDYNSSKKMVVFDDTPGGEKRDVE